MWAYRAAFTYAQKNCQLGLIQNKHEVLLFQITAKVGIQLSIFELRPQVQVSLENR